ncbi:MAG: hypothetical protein ABJA66_18920, partial [Actinomycetota bacterium]
MILKPLARQILAFSLLILFGFSSIAAAHPLANPFLQQEGDVKKLPPVNWIRSRTIDVKHIAIDLKFDWEKESAFGTTTITLAPFKNTNKFNLDAASMTINSVTLAGGTALKFNYDGK